MRSSGATKRAPTPSVLANPRRRVRACSSTFISRPDSQVFGHSVYEVRKELGRQLARENPVEADVVIPVPDSGVPAALGYAEASGIPFELGIIRNHYIGRTVSEPKQSIRSFSVKIKLNPQLAVLKGKRVVVVDDSIVRGTTSKKIVGLVRQFGAKEVHMRAAAPPTTGPCCYGVDTPKKQELIAATTTVDEIRRFIGADTLAYVSNEGLLKASEPIGEDILLSVFRRRISDGDLSGSLIVLSSEEASEIITRLDAQLVQNREWVDGVPVYTAGRRQFRSYGCAIFLSVPALRGLGRTDEAVAGLNFILSHIDQDGFYRAHWIAYAPPTVSRGKWGGGFHVGSRMCLRSPLRPSIAGSTVPALDSNLLVLIRCLEIFKGRAFPAREDRTVSRSDISGYAYLSRHEQHVLLSQPSYSDWQDGVRRAGKTAYMNFYGGSCTVCWKPRSSFLRAIPQEMCVNCGTKNFTVTPPVCIAPTLGAKSTDWKPNFLPFRSTSSVAIQSLHVRSMDL